MGTVRNNHSVSQSEEEERSRGEMKYPRLRTMYSLQTSIIVSYRNQCGRGLYKKIFIFVMG